MMPTVPNFYETLFNHKKIFALKPTQHALNPEAWDGKLGIFCSSNVTSGSEGEKLIQGMMSACKLHPNEWKIFPNGSNYQSVWALKQLQFILLFGITENELNIGLQFPFYHPLRFHNKIWIKAHSLETLSKDPNYKKELWNKALKPLFQ